MCLAFICFSRDQTPKLLPGLVPAHTHCQNVHNVRHLILDVFSIATQLPESSAFYYSECRIVMRIPEPLEMLFSQTLPITISDHLSDSFSTVRCRSGSLFCILVESLPNPYRPCICITTLGHTVWRHLATCSPRPSTNMIFRRAPNMNVAETIPARFAVTKRSIILFKDRNIDIQAKFTEAS